ncbi:hypothetical protein ACJ41O_014166 [Fusarium nematophilum]
METKSLWTLSPQPLQKITDIIGPVFVTIWLFVLLFITYMFWRLLHRPPKTSDDFKVIMYGTGLLACWYCIITVDRWMHYDARPVVYGYLVVLPFCESLRITSTILLLWGTYTFVWAQIRGNFQREHLWWVAAKFAVFLVCMVSFFYWLLYFALAIVWVNFSSLNIIDDVATKRTNFELAMTGMYLGFSLLIVVAATSSVFRDRVVDGRFKRDSLPLYIATIFLLVLHALQFSSVIRAYLPSRTRRDVLLFRDVSEGLVTVLYLVAMLFHAWNRTKAPPETSFNSSRIKSEIRKYILDLLDAETSSGRGTSRAFKDVLADVTENLDDAIKKTLNSPSSMNRDDQRNEGRKYIRQLTNKLGPMNPRQDRNYDKVGSRPISNVTSILRFMSPTSNNSTPKPVDHDHLGGNRTRSRDFLKRSSRTVAPTVATTPSAAPSTYTPGMRSPYPQSTYPPSEARPIPSPVHSPPPLQQARVAVQPPHYMSSPSHDSRSVPGRFSPSFAGSSNRSSPPALHSRGDVFSRSLNRHRVEEERD